MDEINKAATSSELEAMEERITTKLGDQIDRSLKAAVNEALEKLIESNKSAESHPAVWELSKETRKVVTKVNRIESEQSKLKRRIQDLEKRVLENSLVLRGVKDEKWEEEKDTLKKVYQEISHLMEIKDGEDRLEVAHEVGIRRCRRMGRYQPERNRPISLELVHRQDVLYLLEHKKELNKGVYLDKEYSKEVEKKRKVLLPILKAARDTDKYRKRSRMEEDKVVIKGKHYGLNNLDELPEDLETFKITTKEDDNTLAFFGELNPLSNFHPARFSMNETVYSSSEQYIQHTKALFFKDNKTAEAILAASTPHECKDLATNISGFRKSKWDKEAKKLCTPGIHEKFLQNDALLNILVERTGMKTIVESTTDPIWGTSIPIQSPHCLNKTKWTSQGILGEILQTLRDQVTGEQTLMHDDTVITNSLSDINHTSSMKPENEPETEMVQDPAEPEQSDK